MTSLNGIHKLRLTVKEPPLLAVQGIFVGIIIKASSLSLTVVRQQTYCQGAKKVSFTTWHSGKL